MNSTAGLENHHVTAIIQRNIHRTVQLNDVIAQDDSQPIARATDDLYAVVTTVGDQQVSKVVLRNSGRFDELSISSTKSTHTPDVLTT